MGFVARLPSIAERAERLLGTIEAEHAKPQRRFAGVSIFLFALIALSLAVIAIKL